MPNPEAEILALVDEVNDNPHDDCRVVKMSVHTPGGYHRHPVTFSAPRQGGERTLAKAIETQARATVATLQPGDERNPFRIRWPI